MTKDEALKLALEYIETNAHERRHVRWAIKEALAQPEQEPTCPECKAAVLYECVACSSNNYPPPPQPEERNFCQRCGKRTADLTTIHTCTPPQIDPNNRGFPWTQKHNPAPQLFAAMPSNILPPLRTKEAGIDPNQWAFDNGLEST
jgi:DNA-directed RNA polymerase subunit RPC12/RpoP